MSNLYKKIYFFFTAVFFLSLLSASVSSAQESNRKIVGPPPIRGNEISINEKPYSSAVVIVESEVPLTEEQLDEIETNIGAIFCGGAISSPVYFLCLNESAQNSEDLINTINKIAEFEYVSGVGPQSLQLTLASASAAPSTPDIGYIVRTLGVTIGAMIAILILLLFTVKILKLDAKLWKHFVIFLALIIFDSILSFTITNPHLSYFLGTLGILLALIYIMHKLYKSKASKYAAIILVQTIFIGVLTKLDLLDFYQNVLRNILNF